MFCRSDVKRHGLHKRLQVVSGHRRIRCDPAQAVFVPALPLDLRNAVIPVPEMLCQKSDTLRIRDLSAPPAQQRIIEHRIACVVLPVHRLLEKLLRVLRKAQIQKAQRIVVERVRRSVGGRSPVIRILHAGHIPVNLEQNPFNFTK